jgi:hypothetical protein
VPCANPGTFYEAATNWAIGLPVTDGSNLFWTERYDAGSTHLGTVRRKPFVGGGAPANIADGQANVDRRLAIANGNLYFAVGASNTAGPYGIYSLALDASAILRDLAVDAMEVTQGIQNLANGAPLVANKTTYVRVYGKELSGPDAQVVEARLYGTRNNVTLPGSPLAPVSGVRSLRTGTAYDRARPDDSWTFLLPASWTEGAITLRVEIDPRLAYTDPDRTNNSRSGGFTFENQPPVCVWTVPVRTHTPRPSTNDPNFWEMVDRFEQRWPVPDVWIYRDTDPVEELQVCWYGPFPYPCYGPYELEDGWSVSNGIPDRDKVLASLWTRAQLTFNPDACDDIGAPVHFMGMVHPDANNGGASGYASTVSKQSWVQLPAHTPVPAPTDWFAVRPGSVMAQELAHNFGRKHVNCGNPDNIDGSYPYPPCQLDNAGTANYYGFDVRTQTPIPPTTAADFMSYAGRTWVSDYTWRALMNKFAATAVTAAQVPAPDAAGNVVYTAGFIDLETNQAALNYLLVLPQSTLPPQALAAVQAADAEHAELPHAAYKLRLLAANNSILHEEPITPLPLDDHVAGSQPALFSTTFAPPAGQVAKVQLLADTAVIASLTPGLGQPAVSVQQPANGAVIDASLTIQWTASDPDPNDRLLFTVQYSYDGGAQWHTLVSDFPPSPTGVNTLVLGDLGSLHESNGQTALIRVIGSDGYNTAIGSSQSFSVTNRKPDVAILAPANGQSFPAPQPVVLSGAANDAEDGGLSGAALTWAVDGAAAGTGADVAVAGLAPGAHTAALTAKDSSGNQKTATAGFQVGPLGIPQAAAPTLDGFCDDGAYASSVNVPLAPDGDGDQATVKLLRTDTDLWACFSGMKKGASTPGAFAGLRVDVNNSRDASAQASDFGFFAGEDGDVFTTAGDGAGGFAGAGPGGLQAQVSSGASSWSAELRIAGTVLGGLDHLIGLKLGHDWVNFQGDDYGWPFKATFNEPNTWAVATLGDLPALTSLDPYTAIVAGPPFTLTVAGTSLLSGTVVLWNGTPLPTMHADDEHLVAQVGAAQLSNAAAVTIKARSSAAAGFESNGLPFEVLAPAPQIASVAPGAIPAGNPTATITVDGANFVAGAQVLWNGQPLPTTFVNGGRLTAQVDAALLANGQVVGIAVRIQTPEEHTSQQVPFTIATRAGSVYLPAVLR